MKLLLFSIIALVSLAHSAQATQLQPTSILTLSKSNTLVLRGEVSAASITKLELELLAMSARLPAHATIYLVLDTPGGSVSAGLEFIDFAKALPQKIKTVTVFAASMGFQIAQQLDERLILPSATLMSHRASLSGIGGEIPGDLLSRLDWIQTMLTEVDIVAAQRMGISLKKYQTLIADELWMSGRKAVEMKAADRLILAKCDKSFSGVTRVVVGNFMGIEVTGDMSNCPLITGVLNVKLEQGKGTDKEREDAEEYGELYQKSRAAVVRKYICKRG